MGSWWSLLLLAGGLLAWPSLTAAQPGFDPAVNVSQTPTDSRMPHMVVDDTGTLHLAWTDDFRILYTRSHDRGQSFTAALRVSGGLAAALRPRLAVHGATVHLVWTQDPDDATSSEMKEVMYSRSLDGGATFTAPVNLSSSPGHSQEARVAVDSAGTVFVAWDEASPTRHLVLRRSSDGGASFDATRALFAVVMGPCPPGSPNAACTVYPGVAVSPTGQLYVVWHDLVAGQLQVLFSRSLDGGQTFAPPRNISSGPIHAHCAAITVGPSGRILVAWENRKDAVDHKHDAVFAQSTDGGVSFSAPLNLSSGPVWALSDYPWPVEAPDGRIAVGWEDNSAGGGLDTVLALSFDGGLTFDPPLNLSNNPGSASTEVVTLFGPDNTLYVLWEDHATGNGEILLQRTAPPAGPPTLGVVRAGTGSGTVTSAPPGINCGSDCSEAYPAGTAVTLTATPAAGSTFGGWTGGGCGGSGTCTVTVTATTTVTATFTAAGSGPPAFTVGTAAASPNPVNRGQSTTITTTITNTGGPASGILVDMEVYSAANVKVHQQVTTNQAFAAGQSRTFQWTWTVPAGQAPGAYTIKIGVFSGDWSTLYTWHNSAGTVTVQTGGGSGPPAFTVGAATASPNPVSRGASATITTTVTNTGGPASGILVDMEVYNAANVKVHQQVTTNQAFAVGQSRTFQWTWTVPAGQAPGAYTIKIGIFSGDWTTLYTWHNSAGSLTIQ
jgi:hypothetical protein